MPPGPGPVPSPGPARHWWSPAPVPDPGPPISARRAYLEVLGVYAVFFLPAVLAAAGSLANGLPPNPTGWWVTAPNGTEELGQAAAAVAAVVLLAERRGRRPAQIGLAGRAVHGGPGASRGIRMAAWAAVAFVAGSLVTSALASGNYPFGSKSAANTVLDLTAALNAGIVEELVVLAFLVTTLEQARRPRAEILIVALVCRAAYHIYYGPGAVGILIWAAVFVWLFWRFRSVVPMVVTHVCWDSLAFLSRVSTVFGGLLVLGLLGVVVTAVVLWLVERSERRRPAGGLPAVGSAGGWGPPPGHPGATAGPWGPPPVWGPPVGPPPGRPSPAPGPVPPPGRRGPGGEGGGWGPPAGSSPRGTVPGSVRSGDGDPPRPTLR